MASGTNSSSNGSTYTYRADGQRLSKVGGPYVYGLVLSPGGPAYYQINTGTATPVERYYYDGTMGFEDSTTASGTTKVSRYGLGARGIDRIEYYDGSSTTYGYPLYDGHGNMRATLAKNGSGGYTTGNWRTYDVWGSVRDGSATGDPKQRYCASLGHVADDETGLVYMRARHYEPSTGRFVSEDAAMQGLNWYTYCLNNPVAFIDESGHSPAAIVGILAFMIGGIIGFTVGYLLSVWLISLKNPGYTGTHWNAVSNSQLFGGIVAFIAGYLLIGTNEADKRLLFEKPISEFARQVSRVVVRSGWWQSVGYPFTLGLFVGLLIGALSAIAEYVNSDYYKEH